MTARSHVVPMGVEQAEAIATASFPRAALNWPNADPTYEANYRKDCRRLMLAWVAATLADFDLMFGLSPATEDDALAIANGAAELEIERAMYAHEARLVASCVRDHVIVRTALRTAAELRAVMDLLPSSPPKDRAREAASHAGFLALEVEAGTPFMENAP